MRFGVKSHYALLALMDVVAQGASRPVRLIEISERQKLPLPYLEQLFNQLKRKGLVASVRGQKGGYLLAQDPGATIISDVLQAIDEPIQATRCGGAGTTACQGEQERCKMHYLWEDLENHIYNYLSKLSLADVHSQNFAKGEDNNI